MTKKSLISYIVSISFDAYTEKELSGYGMKTLKEIKQDYEQMLRESN